MFWEQAVVVESMDREIVDWAASRSAPCYYTQEHELPEPCLKVHCGHVTAYFCGGRLTRIWAHADHTFLDDMFAELTDLFALCARLPAARGADNCPSWSAARVRLDDRPAVG